MRSIWHGAISFGLLYLPVKMYNASVSHRPSFTLIHRQDHCPIQFLRVCSVTGESVTNEDVVRGHEYAEDQYVVLEDEDFERANPRKNQIIDIVGFIEADAVDEKYFDKPYYLEPAEPAKKVYVLLREALKRSGKFGLARFVLRTREYMGLLKAEGQVIVFNRIRFASELRGPEDLDLPEDAQISQQELDMAVRLVDALSIPWQPEQYKDTFVEDIERIIAEKVRGEEPEPVSEEAYSVEVTNLFEKLSESLQAAERGKK